MPMRSAPHAHPVSGSMYVGHVAHATQHVYRGLGTNEINWNPHTHLLLSFWCVCVTHTSTPAAAHHHSSAPYTPVHSLQRFHTRCQSASASQAAHTTQGGMHMQNKTSKHGLGNTRHTRRHTYCLQGSQLKRLCVCPRQALVRLLLPVKSHVHHSSAWPQRPCRVVTDSSYTTDSGQYLQC